MPSGLIAMAEGALRPPTVQTALLVAVSILVKVLEPVLVTNARVPSGVIAMSLGLVPTGMVLTTVLVAVLITETVPAPLLVT